MSRFAFLLVILSILLPLSVQAQDDVQEIPNKDPFESVNRVIFDFNDGLDSYFLRPVAKGYHFVMPEFAERGVGNFFANLSDANSAANAVLQGRFGNAAEGSGRFLVNSTLGLLGFFDVASRMGLKSHRTDFGHTLASWGLPSGPYLMVPLFGPRTIRSGTGSIFDTYALPQSHIDNVPLRNSLYGLEIIDARASLLQTDELLSGDRYIFIRDAYLQQREVLVNDGKVDDSFSDFDDDEQWEDF